MKKSVTVKYGAALTLLVMFLAGCGAAGTSEPATGSPSPAPRQEQTVVYNLLEEKWAERADTDMEALSWNVADCLEVTQPDIWSADYFFSHSAVEGSCYYVLQDLFTEQGDGLTHALYWTVTNVVSRESVMERWELQAASQVGEEARALLEAFEDNRAWITGMDVSGGKIYLFFSRVKTRRTYTIIRPK